MRVLITGANRGIGAALRSSYVNRGDDTLSTRRGGTEEPGWLSLDVTAPDAPTLIAEALGDKPLDILICNAGVYLDKGHAIESGYAPEIWAETFAANVTGVFQTIRAALPALQAAKGKIAIISSQMASATLAPGGSYVYRASKAAALNLGRNLASDLKSDGIAVGIYHPGWVKTDMGGSNADITVEEAAAGLLDRFDALTLAQTGEFLTWDGRQHPF